MKALGERGRWIGVALAALVLVGVGAALLAANDSSTAAPNAAKKAAAPAATTTATATTADTPLRALHPAAGKFKPDSTTVEQCKTGGGGDFTCWEQAFGNVAYNDGVLKAFEGLNGLLPQNNEAVRADCHTITRNGGSATLARCKGDGAEAIGSGGAMQDATMCGSGFYRGLIEYALRAASSPKALVAKVTAMCPERKALKTTFQLYQCLHGL